MTGKSRSWSQSALWKLIEDRTVQGDTVRQTLLNVMPKIELVLSKGATAPLDFTLHDQDHGFRVAQTMHDLLSAKMVEEMGSIELALLLLSAYLHDIGMTPTREAVTKHHQYILTGKIGKLTSGEVSDFQEWLDYEHTGLELPVAKGELSAAHLDKAEELLAYYCRHKHNDWGEDWINSELADVGQGLYPSWLHDLVTLCRSHHEDIVDLRSASFNSKIVVSGTAQPVNLRYLAAILRVADVLEFDPERTPPVIFKHRDIDPKSKIYWHKDHYISWMIDPKKHQIILSARTPNAHIHKAILDTMDAVNAELLCCNMLSTEKAFEGGVLTDEQRYHEWLWPAQVTADIEAIENSFVYIDGNFRPDAHKVMELLAGTALYGNPLAALRELIQNSVDAVKEQIARQLLAFDAEPSQIPTLKATIAATHQIRLSFFEEDGDYWISCEDSGIGMTRDIIEGRFLVGGAPQNPELENLRRICKARGITLHRSGEFGIGVLSLFMLADSMTVTTRRSDEAGGEPQAEGWRFDIQGLGDFGQLTPINIKNHGSEIRLRLKKDIFVDGPEDWFTSAQQFVASTLRHVPCRFQMDRGSAVESRFEIPAAGWAHVTELCRAAVLRDFRDRHSGGHEDNIRPSDLIERDAEVAERRTIIMERAEDSMRFYGPIEHELEGELGRIRLHLPYFELPGGASLAFLDFNKNKGAELIQGVQTFRASGQLINSWRGFQVNIGRRRGFGDPLGGHRAYYSSDTRLLTEIDYLSSGKIAIDRTSLNLELDNHTKIAKEVRNLSCQIIQSFLAENKKSKFSLLNISIARENFPEIEVPNGTAMWGPKNKKIGDNSEFVWRKIDGPFSEVGATLFKYSNEVKGIKDAGQKILTTTPFKLLHGGSLRLFDTFPCDKIRFIPRSYYLPIPIGLRDVHDTYFGVPALHGSEVSFPPEFSQICTIIRGDTVLWNERHPIVLQSDPEAEMWVRSTLEQCDPRPHIKELLSSEARCAAWVKECLFSRRSAVFWRGLIDQKPKFLEEVFNLFCPADQQPNSWTMVVWSSDLGTYASDEFLEIGLDGVWERPIYHLDQDFEADDIVLPSGRKLNKSVDSRWMFEIEVYKGAQNKRINEEKAHLGFYL